MIRKQSELPICCVISAAETATFKHIKRKTGLSDSVIYSSLGSLQKMGLVGFKDLHLGLSYRPIRWYHLLKPIWAIKALKESPPFSDEEDGKAMGREALLVLLFNTVLLQPNSAYQVLYDHVFFCEKLDLEPVINADDVKGAYSQVARLARQV